MGMPNKITPEMIEAFAFSFWKVNAVSKLEANRTDLEAALTAAFEALEDESEELRIRLAGAFLNIGKAEARATAAEATVTALQEKLAKAAEALEPFAKEADIYDPPSGDGAHAAWSNDFSIGTLRRARTALTTIRRTK